MKKLVLFFLFTVHWSFAQRQTGQTVPDIQFTTLLNAPTETTTLAQLRGKLVLIEFWATWCGPCLETMSHLRQLQRQHSQQLQIITVTDETPKRVRQYLTARPSNVWFAVDTARLVSAVFPHRLIPHTVLLSTDGKLIAQTTPQAITSQVIDSLWRQQTVYLPAKTDNLLSISEVIRTYFKAADTVKNRFIMQAEMKGLPSASTNHLNDSIFRNRRLTCFNLPLTMLYRLAYGNVPYKRTIDKTGEGDSAPVYCLDLIVPSPSALLLTLRQELTQRFDMQAKVEPQTKEVDVLVITSQEKFNRIPRHKLGTRTYSARQGELDEQAITMADFADYLESFGASKWLVVDGTGNYEKLDIKFSFQPENPQSLTVSLSAMGLALTKESRKVDMLLLYK